jgi:hypothetical protein
MRFLPFRLPPRSALPVAPAVATLTLSLSLLLGPQPACAELIGVATSFSPGSLYSINQATGVATLLTNTPGTAPSATGADFRQGVLYVSDVINIGDLVFGTYNLVTGAFTQISNQSTFNNFHGLAYRPSNDQFYSVDGSTGQPLITIHPVTGALTTIANTNTLIEGLAFDQANDILYGVTLDGIALNLVTINPSSGVVTAIGATGQAGARAGLAFDEDNDILYMNLGDGGTTPTSLFTVNTTTGAATLVGGNGPVAGQGIDGLAWRSSIASAAPEPASLALLALSGLPVAGMVIRRTQVRRVAADALPECQMPF